MLPVGFDPMGIFFEVARDLEADGPRAGKAFGCRDLSFVAVAFLSTSIVVGTRRIT